MSKSDEKDATRRTSWSEFVRWYVDQHHEHTAERRWDLQQAADHVTTRNEALVAIIAWGGIADVYEARTRWLAELAARGAWAPICVSE